MLLIFDGYDCTGKTTIANVFSERFAFKIFKRSAVKCIEQTDVKEHRLWAKAQYTMLGRLVEHGQTPNLIFDRWMMSEYCYSPVVRSYDIKDYYFEVENLMKNSKDVLWIYPTVGEGIEAEKLLKKRYDDKKEDFLSFEDLLKVKKNFDELFELSKLPKLKILTNFEPTPHAVAEQLGRIWKVIKPF